MGWGSAWAGVAAAAVLLAAALGLSATPVGAQETGPQSDASVPRSGVPVPQPPKGRGEQCVTETDYIRRYHMVLLNHQRDDTVHEGIRTKRFSLKECIDCHQVKGPEGAPVGYDDPAHFCRSCHDYAAVAIDCFECHAAKPQASASSMDANDRMLALKTYLRERGR